MVCFTTDCHDAGFVLQTENSGEISSETACPKTHRSWMFPLRKCQLPGLPFGVSVEGRRECNSIIVLTRSVRSRCCILLYQAINTEWLCMTEYFTHVLCLRLSWIARVKSNQIYLRHKKAECNITIERMCRQDTKTVQNCTNRCAMIQIKTAY